jgi:hypothetical protein
MHIYSTGRGARRILIPEVKRFGARDIKVGLLARTTDAATCSKSLTKSIHFLHRCNRVEGEDELSLLAAKQASER